MAWEHTFPLQIFQGLLIDSLQPRLGAQLLHRISTQFHL